MQKARENACNKANKKDAKNRKCLITTYVLITFVDLKPFI